MRRFIFFAGVFLFTGGVFSAHAQDLIILRDGSVVEAKVTEISPSEIRYKRYDNLDGPVIVVPASGVLSIRYENGTVEQFGVPAAVQEKPKADSHRTYALDPDRLNFGISLNPAGFIPRAGGGLSVTFDFTKGRFNSQIDIRSGFGIVPSFDGNGYEYFGISSNFNYFHPGRIGGFYIGGMIDYSVGVSEVKNPNPPILLSPGEDYYYYGYDTYWTVHRFGLALNIGYKFVTPSGMYFRTGGAVGYSFGATSVLILRPDISFGYNFSKNTRKR
jgi:hypothetical protein